MAVEAQAIGHPPDEESDQADSLATSILPEAAWLFQSDQWALGDPVSEGGQLCGPGESPDIAHTGLGTGLVSLDVVALSWESAVGIAARYRLSSDERG